MSDYFFKIDHATILRKLNFLLLTGSVASTFQIVLDSKTDTKHHFPKIKSYIISKVTYVYSYTVFTFQ